MQAKPLLPPPWEHYEYLSCEWENNVPNSLGAQLEDQFGARSMASELRPEDFIDDDGFQQPRTRRARIATTFRWAAIRNTETGDQVILRIQKQDSVNLEINALIMPVGSDAPAITNSSLRRFPIAEITAAYSRDEAMTTANLQIFFHLIGDPDFINHPFTPLPPADMSERFLAMAAHQYTQFEKSRPDENPVTLMAELNSKSRQTVQRWLTNARKKQLLPPTRPGRK